MNRSFISILLRNMLNQYFINIRLMKKFIDLKQSYENAKASCIPPKIKKELLQGIANQLKILLQSAIQSNVQIFQTANSKCDLTDTNYTAISHLSIISNDNPPSNTILTKENINQCRQQLEMKIMEKQVLKLSLNEQIENYEDDQFQLQKILITKKQYDSELDDKIAKWTYEINKISSLKCVSRETEVPKSITHRLKNFFLL